MNDMGEGIASQSRAPALRTLDDLPGPVGLPLLGNVLQLKPKRLHEVMSRWAETFGPMFVFRIARTRVLTLADADLVQQVLRERPDTFRRWSKVAKLGSEIKGDGVFSAEGAAWRRQRKFVMYALNAGHVREFVPRLEEVTGRLRRRWWHVALGGSCIDVHVDLMRYTVDVTSGLAFGKDLNTLEEKADPIQQHLDKLFPALARRQTALFPYWRYFELPQDREVTIAVREVRKVIDQLICETRRRLAASPVLRTKPGNLLEALVAGQEHERDGVGDEEIAGNVMTLLLAGEDTTAATISWIIHFLSEHPEVQKAVQEEVDDVIGLVECPWRDPSTPDKLHYLEAVANEAMRCKPVAAHLFLEPNEDVKIGDVLVPKGTPVLALNGHPGTQDSNFANADDFRPERWLNGPAQCAAHNVKAFMPFGAGPRFCPGRMLAMLQIKMVIAMLCRDFEVSRPEGMPAPRQVYAFTVGPDHVYATLRPRRARRGPQDIDLRLSDRRVHHLVISFPERRHGDRRQTAVGSNPSTGSPLRQ